METLSEIPAQSHGGSAITTMPRAGAGRIQAINNEAVRRIRDNTALSRGATVRASQVGPKGHGSSSGRRRTQEDVTRV